MGCQQHPVAAVSGQKRAEEEGRSDPDGQADHFLCLALRRTLLLEDSFLFEAESCQEQLPEGAWSLVKGR